jgi:hypothetical protein
VLHDPLNRLCSRRRRPDRRLVAALTARWLAARRGTAVVVLHEHNTCGHGHGLIRRDSGIITVGHMFHTDFVALSANDGCVLLPALRTCLQSAC